MNKIQSEYNEILKGFIAEIQPDYLRNADLSADLLHSARAMQSERDELAQAQRAQVFETGQRVIANTDTPGDGFDGLSGEIVRISRASVTERDAIYVNLEDCRWPQPAYFEPSELTRAEQEANQ